MAADKLEYLLNRFLSDTATPAEMQEFWQMVSELDDEDALKPQLEQLWLSPDKDMAAPAEGWDYTMQRIRAEIQRWEKENKQGTIRTMTRWAAAAAVLVVLSTGAYFYFNKNNVRPDLAKNILINDIKAPLSSKATITLANGKQIILDSAGNGMIAQQGNVKVTKTEDGQIVYDALRPFDGAQGKQGDNEIQYNMLSNPRGSNVISIILADGSKVWLNSQSTLKYPTAFAGNERRVEITGEAYFEISHDAARKFIVDANDVTTEVLGTHFNINAYDDEGAIRTTLLEGSVRVSTVNRQQSTVIKPGQQAVLTRNPQLLTRNTADVDEVMAWKNGKFYFLNGTNITAIMRQVSRWYDVEVEYKGDISKLDFSGKMSRKENASKLLEILKTTGTVDFKIENKKITVISK